MKRSLQMALVGTVLTAGMALLGCSSSHNAANDSAATKVAMVKDPVCGMDVDPAKAEKATFEGKTYYFCAREEREEFEKNPAKYVKK